jgi:hypothetical protein
MFACQFDNNFFFFFAARLSFCRTIFIALMIDENEDDNSYVAMALHFWSETDVPGTYSTNHGVNQVWELCTPVVLVDIFHFSEICEQQAPSLSHPEVDESRFYTLPIGSTAHPP